MEALTVLVLRGGPSAEREVSLCSGAAVAGALRKGGHLVYEADILPDDLSALEIDDYDLVFPVLHGTFGEDGQLQAILEQRGITFVGSDSLSSQRAMNKQEAKQYFQKAGLSVPGSCLLSACQFSGAEADDRNLQDLIDPIGLPCVVKPNCQGSSVGVTIAKTLPEAIHATRDCLARYGDTLVEQFVRGRELTVGIVGRQVLPLMEVRSAEEFYDYRAKYEVNTTQYLFDIGLPEDQIVELQRQSLKAFDILDCRDLARVDMILEGNGQAKFLEVNTLPGFTTHSLVPKAAKHLGISMPELCDMLVNRAWQRKITSRHRTVSNQPV